MRARVLALLLSCLLLPLSALALEPGERVAPFTLLDQRDRPYTFDDQLQVLAVVHLSIGCRCPRWRLSRANVSRPSPCSTSGISPIPSTISCRCCWSPAA